MTPSQYRAKALNTIWHYFRDHPDSLDPDQQEVMVFPADPVYLDHPARLVNPEKMESRERLEHLERKDSRDQKEPWDHKDLQVKH